MRKNILTLCITLITIMVAQITQAEERDMTGRIGFSSNFSSTVDITMPIGVKQNVVIGPSLSLITITNAGSELGVGVFLKSYLTNDQISPFILLRAGAMMAMPKYSDTVTDWLMGLGTGGDYFLHERFSVGIEVQANLYVAADGSVRFGTSNNLIFNTASVITAAVYF